jgi:hypothetical protein
MPRWRRLRRLHFPRKRAPRGPALWLAIILGMAALVAGAFFFWK